MTRTFQNNEEVDDLVVSFLRELSNSFDSCFCSVQGMKCVTAKTTKLESSFTTLREKPSITRKWALLLDACGLQLSVGTNNILNHVLHHLWTSIVLGWSNEKHALSTTASTSSDFCQDEHDVSPGIEAKTI